MANKRPAIHIVAIPGAVRPGNYTSKAMALVADEFGKDERVRLDVFDPQKIKLAPPGVPTDDPGVKKFKEAVERATGIVMATPEYHGGYSSVIKLAIENLGFPSVLSGKPIALLGVAAGRIGAIKALENLAGVCLHVGAIVLPGSVSVANVRKVFDEDGRCLDPAVEERVRGVATNLLEYIDRHICPRLTLESMVRSE